jgi:hypothetical protein
MSDLPIACTLTAEALAARRAGLLATLRDRCEHIERTPSGVRLRIAPSTETLRAITDAIDAERQCCQFLEFRLTVSPGLGPMWLEVSGPAGTADFLMDLLDGGGHRRPDRRPLTGS